MKAFATIIATLVTMHQSFAQTAPRAATAPASGSAVSGSAASSSAAAGLSDPTPGIAAGAAPTGIAAGSAPTGIGSGVGAGAIGGAIPPSGIGQGIGVNGTIVEPGINQTAPDVNGDITGGRRAGQAATPAGVIPGIDPHLGNGRMFPGRVIGSQPITRRGSIGLGASQTGILEGISSSGALGTSTTGSLGRSTTGVGGVGTSEIGNGLGTSHTFPGTAPSIAAGVTNGALNGVSISTNAIISTVPVRVPSVPAPGSPAAFDARP